MNQSSNHIHRAIGLAIVLAIVAVPDLKAEQFQAADGSTYDQSGAQATLLQIASDATGEFIIPDYVTYNDTPLPVTSVGFRAGYYCDITSLVVGANVVSFANAAMDMNPGLKHIDFGENNIYLGDDAFKGVGVETLTLTANISTGKNVFGNCSKLETLVLEGTSVSEGCFYGCSSLSNISMPNVKTINYHSFANCNSLVNLDLPDGLSTLGKQSFSGCKSLINVTLPSSLTKMESNVFGDCPSLRIIKSYANPANLSYATQTHNDNLHIYVPDEYYDGYVAKKWNAWGSLHRMSDYPVIIGDLAFVLNPENHTATVSVDFTRTDLTVNAETLTIPATVTSEGIVYTVTSIADNAFTGSTAIKTVNLPNTITAIGDRAFSGCTGLTTITIPESVNRLGRLAFEGCTSLSTVTVSASLSAIEDYTFLNCPALTDVNFSGDMLTSIGHKAFYRCAALKTALLPSSVKKVGSQAFYGCGALNTVIKNCRLTEVADSAFMYCYSITDAITVCGTVGNRAFYDDTKWYGSAYPEIITEEGLTYIGASAFYNAKNITSLDLPSTLQTIGNSAFSNCTSLKKTTVRAATPPELGGSSVFYNITGMTVWVPRDAYDAYMANAEWAKLNIKIPPLNIDGICYQLDENTHTATVVANEQDAYKGDIVIPEKITVDNVDYTVTAIADEAFLYCSYVSSITLPATVVTIGNVAFQGTGITTADFSNVKSLGNSICAGCISLSKVTLPATLTKIPEMMFYKCVSLKEISIPEQVTEIGVQAFMGAGLEAVTIPPRVRILDMGCFGQCENLSLVHFPTGLRTIGEYAFEGSRDLKGIIWYDSEMYEGDSGKPDVKAPQRAVSIEPDELTYHLSAIGSGAFSSTGLTYFYVPNTVEKGLTIGDYCFGNTAIARIDVAAVNIPALDTYAFDHDTYNTSLIFVPSGMIDSYKADKAWGQFKCYPADNESQMYIFADEEETQVYFAGETVGAAEGEYRVPDVVTDGESTYDVVAISASALKGTGITSVELPAGVVSYGNSAFEGCESLEQIYYRAPEATPVIARVNRSQIRRPAAGDKAAAIPASLGKNAFYGCTSLTSVTLPQGITTIPENAFRNCTSLTQIDIPEEVEYISESAFMGSGLTNVSLPSTISEVSARAFKDCSALTSVTLPDNLSYISGQAFQNCSSLKSITLPAQINGIGMEAFAGVGFNTIVSLNTNAPWVEDKNAFSDATYDKATLMVPSEAVGSYQENPVWSLFKNNTVTGIDDVEADSSDAETEYYNLQGIRVSSPGPGVYIRRQGNKIEKITI